MVFAVKYSLFLIAALALGAGCGSETPDPEATEGTLRENTWRELDAPDPSWLSCTTDADCTAVDIECCNYCNGGRAIPTNTASQEAMRERYAATCGPTQCTELACGDPTAVCDEGRCELSPDLYR